MSTEGCALQLLRACGIQAQHLFNLLQPFQGQLPQNDQQFNVLTTQLRRYGHISENAQGNIASTLNGHMRQARPGAYMTNTDRQAFQAAAQRTAEAGGATAYYGQSQGQPGGMWDSLLPQPPVDHEDHFAGLATGGWSGGSAPQHTPGEGQQAATWGTQGGAPSGSQTADTWNGQWPQTEAAFPVQHDDDDGTDTDTSSDDGMESVTGPDTTRMTEAQAAEAIYLQYRRAKKVWRRYTGKPVRKFRRRFGQFRRHQKGKGKGRGFFWTQDDVQVFLKGAGKGHRSHTSGKGHGRRKNPTDRNGNTMRCRVPGCNSDEHFEANCPMRRKGDGKGAGSSPSPFSGLTIAPNASQPAESRQAARGSGDSPWADEDMFYDPPRDFFAAFGEEATDPFMANDPWGPAAGASRQSQQQERTYGPRRRTSRPPSSRGSRMAEPAQDLSLIHI